MLDDASWFIWIEPMALSSCGISFQRTKVRCYKMGRGYASVDPVVKRLGGGCVVGRLRALGSFYFVTADFNPPM